jgi:hypothetical protein
MVLPAAERTLSALGTSQPEPPDTLPLRAPPIATFPHKVTLKQETPRSISGAFSPPASLVKAARLAGRGQCALSTRRSSGA